MDGGRKKASAAMIANSVKILLWVSPRHRITHTHCVFVKFTECGFRFVCIVCVFIVFVCDIVFLLTR